ncbi:MAG: UvrD-helicase domain-containing protein, partial [Clostridia bacterium]|nr:UvrD-helicase domain-containing protein [Clostridia bacterium]
LYAEEDPVFRQLVELLATGRDDASLEENILRLHTFSRAYPSPQRWLEESLALYDDPGPAFRIVRQSLLDLLESWRGRWNTVLSALEVEPPVDGVTFDGTVDCIRVYLDLLDELEGLLRNEQWDAFREAVDALDVPTLKKPSVPKDLKDLFSSPALELAKQWKSSFTNAKLKAAFGAYHLQGPDEARADHAQLRPLAEKLTEAVLRFDTLYAGLKREENALDFADTELFALELLVEDPGAEPVVPKELALALREQYEEILIDEYQDTNKLQDTVFASISRDDLFMVGDVKQSIYRFRQAMPELFLEKKDTYPVCEAMPSSYPATVILGKNYRSRKGILDTVNYTFTRLMSREVGEISYDESEKLRFGAEDRYPDRDEPDVELHIVVPDAEQDKREAEAAHIARFIAEEIARSKETESPLSYRDFAILLRSAKPAGNTFRKVLTEAGIPAYAEQGAGFLEAPEVMTMVSLLEVIDNPVQDVPLLAVLLSPVFGYSEEEVAALRVASRRDTIYKALLAAEERGDAHVAATLEQLRRFRTLAVSMGAGELLRKVYEETSYPALAGAMLAGDQRTANLRLLLQYADSYDDNSSYGLAGFVRYLGRLREQGGALTTAATLSPNADVVQIMSIHKSKGLEFKVCILADLKHQFNDRDLNRSVILHPELGIGLRGRQPDTGFTYPTLAHTALKEATLRSARSEELRVLYVAMTRAKEKLILSACDAPTKKQTTDPLVSSLGSAADRLYGDAVVPPYEVLHARTFYQWLLMALLPHPSCAPLRAFLGETADLLPSVPDDADTAPLRVVLDRTEAAESLPS